MSLFSMFSNDLGVDLGTSNVLIYADGKGIVVRGALRCGGRPEHRQDFAGRRRRPEYAGQNPRATWLPCTR